MNIIVDRAVIEQALEALVAAYQGKDKTNQVTESITSLRTALEQPEQEPVAWVYSEGLEALKSGKPWTAYGGDGSGPYSDLMKRIPLYTAPPQRKPLTDEQKLALCKQFPNHLTFNAIEAIEAAHNIKD